MPVPLCIYGYVYESTESRTYTAANGRVSHNPRVDYRITVVVFDGKKYWNLYKKKKIIINKKKNNSFVIHESRVSKYRMNAVAKPRVGSDNERNWLEAESQHGSLTTSSTDFNDPW